MADKKKPVNESQLENEIDWSAYTAAQTKKSVKVWMMDLMYLFMQIHSTTQNR